jgi:hypothetical protein
MYGIDSHGLADQILGTAALLPWRFCKDAYTVLPEAALGTRAVVCIREDDFKFKTGGTISWMFAPPLLSHLANRSKSLPLPSTVPVRAKF